MKRLAIYFYDNDFWLTYQGIGNIILDSYLYNKKFINDKKKICELVNKLAPIIYVTHQDQNSFFEEELYLEIEEDDIFIDDETDFLFKESEHIIIDFENKQVYVL